MGESLTRAQKCWGSACILWLISIVVAYQEHFYRSAGSTIIILFIGGLPMMAFLIYLATSKYQHSHRNRSRDVDPLPIVILFDMISERDIAPEPREPPHTNVMYNSNINPPITYVYKKEGMTEGNDCAVCLGQLQKGEMMARLQFCSHLFHEKCISPWLRLHKTCPICRRRVDQKVAEESIVRHVAAVV